MNTPPNWPAKIRYITHNISFLDEPITFTQKYPVSSNIILKKVPKEHPAYSTRSTQGFGVFAKENISKNTVIGEYCGVLVPKLCFSNYAVQGNEEYLIDAAFAGNEMRFINDYRGIAQENNVEFRGAGPDKVECIVVAIKNIKKGEELLVDYGNKFWESPKRKVHLKYSLDENEKEYESLKPLF